MKIHALLCLIALLGLSGCKSENKNNPKTTTAIKSIASEKKNTPRQTSDSQTSSTTVPRPTISTDDFQTTYTGDITSLLDTRFHGKITLEDKTPIKNGKIIFGIYKSYYYQELGTKPHAETRLLPDGRFALNINSKTSYQLSFCGDNITTAKISLYSSMGVTRKTPGKAQEFDTEFNYILPAVSSLSGQILNKNNAPLSGATVAFTNTNQFDNYKYGLKFLSPSAVTNAKGNFTINGIPHGTGDLLAAHPEFMPVVTRNISVPTSATISTTLKDHGGIITGSVTTLDSNAPVANAEVRLTMVPGQLDYLGFAPYFNNLIARTDNTGAFTVQHLPPVEFKVFAETKSPLMKELSWDKDNKSIFHLKDGETSQTQIRLYPGHTVTGQVFDKESQDPLADVTLSTDEITSITKTDSSGNYKITGLFSDTKLTPWLPKYKQYNTANPVSTKNPYDLNIELDIPMIKTITVSGTVKSTDNIPIPNATIYFGTSIEQILADPPIRSDKAGHYTLETTPFSQLLMVAKAEGFASKQVNTIETSIDDINSHDIVLNKGITISGQILNEDNMPVGGANIRLYQNIFFTNGSSSIQTENESSDALGNFTISNVSSAAYTNINFSHPNYGYRSETVSNLNLSPGDIHKGLTVHLKKVNKLGGVVKTPSGKAAANIWISIDMPDGVNTGANSDIDGIFTSGGTTTGTYKMSSPDKEFDTVLAPLGKTDIVLRLHKEPKEQKASDALGNVLLTVNIIDKKTQKPVSDFKFRMMPIAGSPTLDKENPGVLTVKQLLEGTTYDLVLSAPGYMEKTFKIEIPPDADSVNKTLEMETGGSITGIVKDKKTNEPLPNVVVQNLGPKVEESGFEEGTRPLSYGVTDSEGKFTLSPIAEGKTTIKIVGREPYISQSHKVDIQTDKNTDAGIILMHDGSSISGKVINFANAEKGKNTVRLKPDNRNDFITETINNDGTYAFKGLNAGIYYLTSSYGSKSVNLGEDEEKEVDLESGNIKLIFELDKREDQQPRSISIVHKNTKLVRRGNLPETTDIDKLMPGQYSYSVTENRIGTHYASGEFTLPEDESEFHLKIVLNKGRIKGKLQTSQGKPIPNATIKLKKAPDVSSKDPFNANPTESVNDGTFEFDNLPTGTYSLTAQKNDVGLISKNDIKIGQADTNIVLTMQEKGGNIESMAINGDTGEPIRGAIVTLSDRTHNYTYDQKRDANGITTIKNIPPGKYAVAVSAGGYTSGVHEVQIESEKTVVIEDALYQAGSLTWKILTEKGEPAKQVSVAIFNANPKSDLDNRTVTTDDNGSVTVEVLSLGNYTLTATSDEKSVSEQFLLIDDQRVEKESRFNK